MSNLVAISPPNVAWLVIDLLLVEVVMMISMESLEFGGGHREPLTVWREELCRGTDGFGDR